MLLKNILKSSTRILANKLRLAPRPPSNVNFHCNFIYYQPTNYFATEEKTLSHNEFLALCDETLETLYETYESKEDPNFKEIELTSGILKLELVGEKTIIINRQTPNKQIWYSSPISGPQRYNYDLTKKKWINGRDQELSEVLNADIDAIIALKKE